MPLPSDFPDDIPDEVRDWLAEDYDTEEWVSARFLGDPGGWELEIEYEDGSVATINLSDYDDWMEWMWDLYDWLDDEVDDVDASYTED